MSATCNTPQEIIQKIVNELHMSVRSFALRMNESYSKIYEIYSGRTRVIVPSVQQSISECYGVDINFLRTGRGEIFVRQPNQPVTTDDVTNSFLNVIATMSEENRRLKERVSELEDELRRISEALPSYFTNGVFNG